MNQTPAADHLLDLLAARATQGLSKEEDRELHALLSQHPEFHEDTLEFAAAEVDLAMTGRELDVMPEMLRTRLHELAEGYSKTKRFVAPAEFPRHESQRAEVIPLFGARLGWAAAVAAVLLAAVGWWQALQPDSSPSVQAQRAELLQTGRDVISLAWTATEDPAARNAAGDVVWSTSQQQGFMRIVGLEPNDASVSQYQLWVFDEARDQRYPVDGGVFDIPAGAQEVLVPIHTAIAVDSPTLFAITVEQPGGVVVSERERIVLLAQPKNPEG